MIMEHFDMQSVLEFWMNHYPSTESIVADNGSVVFPQKVIPDHIAQLVYRELINGHAKVENPNANS
jgi:hypothetical protein